MNSSSSTRNVTLPSSDFGWGEREESSHRFSTLGDDDRLAAVGDVVEKLEAFGLESSCGDRAHGTATACHVNDMVRLK